MPVFWLAAVRDAFSRRIVGSTLKIDSSNRTAWRTRDEAWYTTQADNKTAIVAPEPTGAR